VGKLAFVYPGQGSQKVGMGADLSESDPELFDRYLSLADEASRLPIRKLCLEGPPEELTRTDVTQPALFAVGMALTELARELGLAADYVAGHSLGEYSAAVASGALGVEEGMRLVSERGRRMAEVQSERPGAMAAILGLDVETLSDVCDRASDAGVVSLANLNTPTQTVISGEEAGVVRAMELADEAGAAKSIRLQVGGAFHSELMKPVQAALAETMEGLSWSDPQVPLVANHSGQTVTTADDVRAALVAQIATPVRWVDCVQTLAADDVDRAVELGPGRVLGGLIRKIDPQIEPLTADSRQALEALPARGGAGA
jgi:[acyl-carrier-protein] S-malonyltransferase